MPKDLVITWVVVVLDNLLIYFWGARLGQSGHYPNQKVPIQKIPKLLGCTSGLNLAAGLGTVPGLVIFGLFKHYKFSANNILSVLCWDSNSRLLNFSVLSRRKSKYILTYFFIISEGRKLKLLNYQKISKLCQSIGAHKY